VIESRYAPKAFTFGLTFLGGNAAHISDTVPSFSLALLRVEIRDAGRDRVSRREDKAAMPPGKPSEPHPSAERHLVMSLNIAREYGRPDDAHPGAFQMDPRAEGGGGGGEGREGKGRGRFSEIPGIPGPDRTSVSREDADSPS